jgi:hypothetical protein
MQLYNASIMIVRFYKPFKNLLKIPLKCILRMLLKGFLFNINKACQIIIKSL